MAVQSFHDVVNQPRSGGESSPSGAPEIKPDNFAAGSGDGERLYENAASKPQGNSQEASRDNSGAQTSSHDIEHQMHEHRTVGIYSLKRFDIF